LIRRFDHRVWNAFSEKLVWRDLATNFIEDLGKEEGLDKRLELKPLSKSSKNRKGRGATVELG